MEKILSYLSFQRVPGQSPELDGLRGIAVILVLLRHAARPYWSPDEPLVPIAGWDFGTFMINGWVGVDLFFVLSGFLITHHILKQYERNNHGWDWRPYLAKRALRIVPAYYAVLFLAALGAFPYYDVEGSYLGVRVVYHMLFLQDYLPANIVVAFWSLGVEEKFYLLAPFVILARANAPTLRKRVSGILLFFALGIMLRFITTMDWAHVNDYEAFFPIFRSPFHMTLDPILIGVLLAFIYRSRSEVPEATTASFANTMFWSGAALFVASTTTGAMLDEITLWDKAIQPTVIALAFGGITFGLLFGGGPGALFRSTILFFFARISYCLYLVHIPLIPLSMMLAESISGGQNVFSIFFVIFCSLSVLAALTLHYLIEKPFLRIKDAIGPGKKKPRIVTVNASDTPTPVKP